MSDGFDWPGRWFSVRPIYLYIFFYCLAMMLVAVFYFQRYLGLEPCPLCSVQRLYVIIIGALALAAFIHDPGVLGRRIYAGLALAAGLAGIGTAGRHLYLQSLPPDKLPECGPGLDFMLDVFPLVEVIKMVFAGSGECGEVQWSLLGLSIPGWTLVGFLGLIGAWGYLLLLKE